MFNQENIKTKWELAEIFKVSVKTIERNITEMRRSSEFQKSVLDMSQKRRYIDYQGYLNFALFKEKQRKKML